MDLYSRLESDIRLSRLSPNTSKHYLPHCRKFFSRFPDRAPDDLGEADVRAYLHHLVDERKVSQYTHKMAVAALKFLFQHTLQRPEVVAGIPWPKIREALAVVLAHQELLALFRAADSPLVRAAMLCGYAAGLRVSEVCRLQVPDIDSQRGVLVVRCGKGDKGRQTVLSARLLGALRKYWKETKPSGSWLFPGRTAAGHVGKSRVQKGFRTAMRSAGVRREGARFHSLRHSFATHMLEAGVDIRVLQALLGHRHVKTTSRYAQVRTDLIASLPDPLDLLARKITNR